MGVFDNDNTPLDKFDTDCHAEGVGKQSNRELMDEE